MTAQRGSAAAISPDTASDSALDGQTAGVHERIDGWTGVRVLERAAALLSVLEEHDGPVPLGVLAQQAGLSKPTAYRLVQSLLQLHLVEPGNEPGTYRLGIWLFRLGASVQRRLDVRTRARPHLARLNGATEETTYLCIRDELSVVCVEQLEGKHVSSLRLRLGGSLPLNLGAASRVFLASLPEAELERFLAQEHQRLTVHSLTGRQELLDDVRHTREMSYVFSNEDVTPAVCAVGAPIFDAHGVVVAAVSISGVAPRFSEPRLGELVRLVRDTAWTISKDLGCHPDARPTLPGRIPDDRHSP